jgi:hypothetical protein
MKTETILLVLHMSALMLVLWNIASVAYAGLMWVRGKKTTLDIAFLKRRHHGAWMGYVCMVLTGIGIFSLVHSKIVYNPFFYIKMGFVIALFINGFAIGVYMKIASTKSYASLSHSEKIPLLITMLVSMSSWLGAMAVASFILPE